MSADDSFPNPLHVWGSNKASPAPCRVDKHLQKTVIWNWQKG